MCVGSIVFKNEIQTPLINTEIFRFSYDSPILLRSRFLDVTQLQRNVGGTLRDIQKTAGRETTIGRNKVAYFKRALRKGDLFLSEMV